MARTPPQSRRTVNRLRIADATPPASSTPSGISRRQGRLGRQSHRHPERRLANTERFWLEYAVRDSPHRVPIDSIPELEDPNTLRFWLEQIQRPPPKRAVSAPPTARKELPPMPSPPPLPSFRAKILSKFRSLRSRLASFLSKARGWTPSRRTAFISLLTGAVGAYLAVNTHAYIIQPPVNIPSILNPALLNTDIAFASDPTWLYTTSPSQMLGLPEPLFPRAVQPANVIERQYRQSFKFWGPDSGPKHRKADPGQPNMDKIARRMTIAKDLVYDVAPWNSYKNYTKGTIDVMGDWLSEDASKPDMGLEEDGLPYYRPRCVCTLRKAVAEGVKHAVTPYWMHKDLPKTAGELKEYCPCSLDKAVDRLVYGYTHLPPPISRFYKDLELMSRWDPGSFILRWWGNGGAGGVRAAKDYPKEEVEQWKEAGWLEEGNGKRDGDMPLGQHDDDELFDVENWRDWVMKPAS